MAALRRPGRGVPGRGAGSRPSAPRAVRERSRLAAAGPGRVARRPLPPTPAPTRPLPERRLPAVSTARVAVLLLVLAGLALSAVLPVRTYLEQRSQISALQRQVEQEQAGVASLQVTAAQWQDPAFVSAQARARLRLVAPGETGYIVTDSGPSAAPTATPTAAVPSAAVPSTGVPTSAATPGGALVRGVVPTTAATGVATPAPTVTAPVAGTPVPTAPVGTGADGVARLGSPSPWWSHGATPAPSANR